MKKYIWITVWIAFLLAIILIPTAHAEAPSPTISEMTSAQLIEHYSELYGSSSNELEKVMACESGGNQKAIGDNGHSKGVYQYWEGTFNEFSKELGQKMDYNSSMDQIQLTAWAFSKGTDYKNNWTCYRWLVHGKIK